MAKSNEEKLQAAYVASGGKAKALPWAEIIQILMTLFAGCTPKQAKAWSKDHPVAAKALIRSKLRAQGLPATPEVVNAVFTVFSSTSANTLQAMLDD